MKKFLFTAAFTLISASAYCQNSTSAQKVINPFSDEYKKSLDKEGSSGMLGDTSTRKVKYISTLSRESSQPPLVNATYNNTLSSQNAAAQPEKAPDPSLLSNATTGQGEGIKIIKSK